MILTRDGKEILAIYRQDGSEIEEVKDANGLVVYSALREITGTLPLSFYSLGKPLTDYLISGNTLQDGTPSPEAPVDVVGCGARTGNLFDKSTALSRYRISVSGVTEQHDTACSDFIYVHGQSFIHANDKSPATNYYFYKEDKTLLSYVNNLDAEVPSDAFYVRVNLFLSAIDTYMLNTGSTALPYEPYGYKLPLTVNGTAYPIYLGIVPTTRKIKKLVLTGDEADWIKASSTYSGCFYKSTQLPAVQMELLCTHLPYIAVSDFVQGTVTISKSYRINLWFEQFTSDSTVADFRSYLQQQYANGTPVTVWYVLAEQETGIVNEPLMKIGDYVDTISFAQAGVTIPTTTGTNTLTVPTEVPPSEVWIRGNIKDDNH